MRCAGDVGVGQDGEKLRRGAAQDSRRVDVAHSACEGGGHRLQSLFRCPGSVGLDEQDTKVALVAVRASELVLEHRAHKPIVEQSRRAVDDMQRLGHRIVDLDPARWTEDRARG
jgi:hypothetical protein